MVGGEVREQRGGVGGQIHQVGAIDRVLHPAGRRGGVGRGKAQVDVFGLEFFAQRLGSGEQQAAGGVIGKGEAAIRAERRGDQGVAENRMPDVNQCQQAGDAAFFFGLEAAYRKAVHGAHEVGPLNPGR